MNLGVRYDYSKGMFPSFPLLDASGLPTGAMSAANDDVYHWNTFSPRVGVNYRVNASGRSCSRRTTGATTRRIEAGRVPPGGAVDHAGVQFTLDAAGNRINVVQVSSNANLRIDPDFKSAYNDQYIVQIEQEVMRDLGLQVNYVHKRGEDYGALAGHRRQLRAGAVRRQRRHRRDRRDGHGLPPGEQPGGPRVPADESRTGCTCATTA